MFSCFVHHLYEQGTMLASRSRGVSSGTIKPVRKHYDIAMSYLKDEDNGSTPVQVDASFPSGTYSALDYTPVWTGHGFTEWHDERQTSEPKLLEYVEMQGSEYINTGLVFTPRDIVELDGAFTEVTTRQQRLLQQRPSTGLHVELYINGSGNTGYAYEKDNLTGWKSWGVNISTARCVWRFDGPDRRLRRTIVSSGSSTSVSLPAVASMTDEECGTTTLKIGRYAASDDRLAPRIRIYGFKMWKNGTLVRDMVPAVDGYGKTGLYDKVGETTYASAHGSLVAGPYVEDTRVYPSDSVVYDRPEVYAHWQFPTTVVFDATTNGGQMPSGWISPDYFYGKPFGILPVPVKQGEVFDGWYNVWDEPIVASSIVYQSNLALTAKYKAARLRVSGTIPVAFEIYTDYPMTSGAVVEGTVDGNAVSGFLDSGLYMVLDSNGNYVGEFADTTLSSEAAPRWFDGTMMSICIGTCELA